jgi:hypothetical protein
LYFTFLIYALIYLFFLDIVFYGSVYQKTAAIFHADILMPWLVEKKGNGGI